MNGTVTAREQKQKELIRVHQLAASKRFGRYKDEEKKKIRKADIKGELNELVGAWKNFISLRYLSNEGAYDKAAEFVRRLSYSSRDVERFAIILTEFQEIEHFETHAGNFLSAMINEGIDCEFRILLNHLDTALIGIGYLNTKRITIIGDVKWGVGIGMRDGEIHVLGSCGDNLGSDMKGGSIIIDKGVTWGCDGIANEMHGGEIVVKGKVEGKVGLCMSGGKIVVLGDVILNKGWAISPDYIGNQMTNGEIHIRGDIIGNVKWNKVIHGKIYHKGKLIVDK